MADIEKAIKNAVEADKAVLGSDETLRALMAGELSLVVMASNCPQELAEKIGH
ncbi:MAG: ribosomal L7Ae/L30e/S12e/Gadd45 family protein, partial [Candidatus Aenigmarchaeota archaeon]|nr:ribosomal L7Ae/L30e/S12e/Gadd45 family protein [Candidatus Aenigmarchaeota archaeon]